MSVALRFSAYFWLPPPLRCGFRIQGSVDLEAAVEGLLYLTTLIFWILVIASLVLIKKTGGDAL